MTRTFCPPSDTAVPRTNCGWSGAGARESLRVNVRDDGELSNSPRLTPGRS